MEVALSLAQIFSVVSGNPLHELSLFFFVKAVQRVHSVHALFKSLFRAVSLSVFAQKSSESFPVVITESLFDVSENASSSSRGKPVKMLV